MTIEPADFDDPSLLALLQHHLACMHANTPPEAVHALDLSGLKAADMTLYVLKRNGIVAGMGGLKELDADWGEIKSMRTHPDHLRQGIAAAILQTLIGEARRRGYRRLSLETGVSEEFDPALTLYRRHGFCNGGPFAEYIPNEYCQFLHLNLD
jgi:putative acetyltransferase